MKKLPMPLLSILFLIANIFPSCSKSSGNSSSNGGGGNDTITVHPQTDPALANTIGFFINDWEAKTFTNPTVLNTITPPVSTNVTVTVDRNNVITKIPKSIAGNNANVWMGQFVTESTLINNITALHPHIIRFPGGSVSDDYFWNAAVNNRPADAPAQLVNYDGNIYNKNYWFGKNTATLTLSLDNYYNMLQLTGNQGMIIVNYGYARYSASANPVASAAHLAADWVRYDNGRTKYWEVGNENYGHWETGYRINTANNQDGQPEFITGLLYGQHFKVFADSMRKAAQEMGKTIYIGAVTVESAPAADASNTLKNWNAGLFGAAGNSPDFYAVHNYYTAWKTNANAAEILGTPQTVTQTMMNFVKQSIYTAGLIQKPVSLTEWNITSWSSKQQVSHINGMHAVMVIGESLKNKIGMTARWDFANGWDDGNDHGMFNIGDEPDGVPKWNPRPSFYHMYFFQKYLGDRLVSSTSSSSSIVSYASSFSSGETSVALVNIGTEEKSVEIKVSNFSAGANFYYYKLTGGTENGEFSRKTIINGVTSNYASGGPANYATLPPDGSSTAGGIKILVPPRSSVFIVAAKK